MKTSLFSTFMNFGFLTGRYYFTYACSYFAAILALVMLALRPTYKDLITITALFAIALCSDLGPVAIEIRYLAFAILFLVAARSRCFDPRILFAVQLLFVLLAMANSGVAVERFVFGAAVSAVLLMIYLQDQQGRLLQRISEKVLFVFSLFMSLLGYGSRAALAIWLVINRRVAVVFLPVAAISISLFMTSFVVDIPVFGKAFSVLDALFSEASPDGEVHLRALENSIFFDWATTAPAWQFIMMFALLNTIAMCRRRPVYTTRARG